MYPSQIFLVESVLMLFLVMFSLWQLQ